MDNTEFLGRGLKFPFQVNRATGRVVMSEADRSIRESVYLILMTARGERFLRPDFGSSINNYAFMDVNLTQLTVMNQDITRTLLEQEPRIADVDVTINPQLKEGCLIINIDYRIIESNTRDNLVFPFYLHIKQEESDSDEYEPEEI